MTHGGTRWKVLCDGRAPTLGDAAAGRLAKAISRIDGEPGVTIATDLSWGKALRIVCRANDTIDSGPPWRVAARGAACILLDGEGGEVADGLSRTQADAIAAAYNAACGVRTG